MKKIFTFLLITNSLVSFAQELIVEEKFEKDNDPARYWYNEDNNTIIIAKGNTSRWSLHRKITKINIFNSRGEKQVLIDNGENYMRPAFLQNERKLYLQSFGFNREIGKKEYELDLYGNLNQRKKVSFSTILPFYENEKFDVYYFFTDKELRKYKKTRSRRHNYKYEIDYKNETSRVNFFPEKNSVSEMGDFNFENKTNNNEVFFADGTYELTQKFVHKQCNKVKVFRIKYDLSKEKPVLLKKNEFLIDIEENNFVISLTGGGGVNKFNEREDEYFDYQYEFYNNSSITNFIEDENNNVYFYGLFGENKKEGVKDNDVLGYFIQKFDMNGNLIWKKKYPFLINSEKKLKLNLNRTFVRLYEINGKLTFTICFDQNDEYAMFSNINKSNGELINEESITFVLKKTHGLKGARATEFIKSFYCLNDLNKNLRFDENIIAFYLQNKKIKEYINQLSDSKMIQLTSFISKEGIWLLETDNESYYKVLYFNHE